MVVDVILKRKNIKLILGVLVFLLISVISINQVNAEEIFYHDWDSAPTSFGKTNWNAMYKMDNIALGDTILTISYTYGNDIDDSKCESDFCLIIKQYDKKGNQINELYIQNVFNYITANVIDNNLYMVVNINDGEITANYSDRFGHYESTSLNTYLMKFDVNLKKKAELQIGDEYNGKSKSYDHVLIFELEASAYCPGLEYSDSIDCSYSYSKRKYNEYDLTDYYLDNEPDRIYNTFYYHYFYDYYDFYQIHEEGDNIVIYSTYEDFVIDKNLTSVTTRDNTWKEKYGKANYSYNFIDSSNYLVAGSTDDSKGFLKLISNDKETLNITSDDYYSFDMPIKVDNHYLALGQSKSDKKEHVIVFDTNGNKLQDIVSSTGDYWNLRAIPGGFAVINTRSSVLSYANNSSGANDIYTEVYYLKYNIETKVKGKGTIEVVDTSAAGKEVTFKVTPAEGYVLGSVKVTDENGNTVTFTNSTFTMPSANVTIEANFVVENPNTKDIAIFTGVALLIVGAIALFIGRKKLNWLK